MATDLQKIHAALGEAMRRYPNCKIANCDCNSKKGERLKRENWRGEVAPCNCFCHPEVWEEIKVKEKS